jgi:hypothetical protein
METTRITADKTQKIDKTAQLTAQPMEFIIISFVAKEIWLEFDFITWQGMVAKKALIDSRANKNCIDIKTAQKLRIKPRLLPQPMGLRNVDGIDNRREWVKYWLPIAMFHRGKVRMLKFLIVDLGRDQIIFGYPWLWEFNPEIDWPTKYIKGPPFLAADVTIEPDDLLKHTKLFTRWRYLNPNGQALIWHLHGEYEDNDPPPGTTEEHTFVTTFQPRETLPTPTPPGVQERIQKELNRVEKYLDLTKTTQTRQMPESSTEEDQWQEIEA